MILPLLFPKKLSLKLKKMCDFGTGSPLKNILKKFKILAMIVLKKKNIKNIQNNVSESPFKKIQGIWVCLALKIFLKVL